MKQHPRNRTYEEKLLDALDNKIKNIEPSKRDLILKEMKNYSDFNSVVKIAKFIIEKFFVELPENGTNTTKYWLARGWGKYTSKQKVKEFFRQKPKRFSPMQTNFWITRINPITNSLYTETEAIYKINSQRPINKEYWLEKGYVEEESILLASSKKLANDELGRKNSGKRSTLEIRKTSKRCKEYWIERGYDEETASREIAKLQTTFSLEKCIEKSS